MPCSKETLAKLLYNASSSFLLLLLFLYLSITFLLKLLHFIGSYPLIQRNQNDFDYIFSEEEEEVEYNQNKYLHVESTADSISFESNNNHLHKNYCDFCEELPDVTVLRDPVIEELKDGSFGSSSDEQFSSANDDDNDLSPSSESPVQDDADVVEQEIPKRYADPLHDYVQNQGCPTFPTSIDQQHKSGFVHNDRNRDIVAEYKAKVDSNFSEDGNFLVYAPTKLESKKLKAIEKEDEEIFGDSCTNGSTSKSSSEWRSSINCRDSGTEDPFSSSSRRSCPKWESYTVFQRYDEEMMFLDRISAQKLHETESLRSIKACPRSISERIVHKFATINKTRTSDIRRNNPYRELEAAYVAQICLTWEALNWNYMNFQRKRSTRRRDFDPGCPAGVAQQFQQFQVLLQRYIENEPFEQGRRPEIYARMRLLAPKLLLVPEYRDCEDGEKDEGFGSRISTASFLMIMEDGIRTFMSFLKADKEKPCQILKAFFSRNRRGSVDPTLLHLTKKVNNKKKMKLKDLRRARNCIRKRKLTVDEEMEILMGLIDLKVVSRVLRMSDLGGEQMHWCEEKMSKVRVSDGKLQRDSSTVFFPSH